MKLAISLILGCILSCQAHASEGPTEPSRPATSGSVGIDTGSFGLGQRLFGFRMGYFLTENLEHELTFLTSSVSRALESAFEYKETMIGTRLTAFAGPHLYSGLELGYQEVRKRYILTDKSDVEFAVRDKIYSGTINPFFGIQADISDHLRVGSDLVTFVIIIKGTERRELTPKNTLERKKEYEASSCCQYDSSEISNQLIEFLASAGYFRIYAKYDL